MNVIYIFTNSAMNYCGTNVENGPDKEEYNAQFVGTRIFASSRVKGCVPQNYRIFRSRIEKSPDLLVYQNSRFLVWGDCD